MSVAVLTDSAASLPRQLAARLNITVLPLALVVGGESMHDGDLSLDVLLARLDEGVTTSGVSPGEMSAALETRLADPDTDAVLVLTVSSEMSMTYQAACLGADMVDSSGMTVRVMDTGTAAGAQGLVVLAAAERAMAGGDLGEVAAEADRVADRVRLMATVDSLDQLVRSGRVPGIAGWAGRRLGVQPLFEFRRGKVRRLRPAFSTEAALQRIVNECRTSRPSDEARLRVAALHALAPDRAIRLLAMASDGVEGPDTFIGAFSPVMVAHTGPGLAGLAWWWDTGRPSS